MITLDEIKKKAIRVYPQFLRSTLLGESFFPYVLRSDKSLSNDFVQMSKEISELLSGSKDRLGYGYEVSSRPVKTRNHGVQDIPEAISFKQQDDYLKFIGKTKEFNLLLEDAKLIEQSMPTLREWISQNPMAVVANNGKWVDLLKVCNWFVKNFEPSKYYIRELPISVYTKFIEENASSLGKLLDYLIPEKIKNEETEFERRYHLNYIQPQVRFRSLSPGAGDGFFDDISVPLDKFLATPQPCRKVFIIENKMNFLTFPEIEESIAVWGKGFAIENLRAATWLKSVDIFYWSDLDVQGFQMLSQLRSYFPQTRAFLMDEVFLERLEEYIVPGSTATITSLVHLNEAELSLLVKLKNNNLRLEQERIPQSTVVAEVQRLRS